MENGDEGCASSGKGIAGSPTKIKVGGRQHIGSLFFRGGLYREFWSLEFNRASLHRIRRWVTSKIKCTAGAEFGDRVIGSKKL